MLTIVHIGTSSMQSMPLNDIKSQKVREDSIFANGTIGWLGFKSEGPIGYAYWLVTYHLSSEQVKECLLPQHERKFDSCKLIDFKGMISVIRYDDYAQDFVSISIWSGDNPMSGGFKMVRVQA